MAQSLNKIKGNTYYINSAVNIGIVTDDEGKAIIIDTGIDDDMGRRILKLLKEEGLTPAAIINTHFHADHCGGNSFITKRQNTPIYATALEKSVIEHPILEPFSIYSAYPLKAMQNKFLMAKESKVSHIIKEGEIKIEGINIEVIPLPGHSPEMVGIATSDNIIFIGDAFFSERILSKYPLAYFTDIKSTLMTLEKIKTMNYDYFVPAHGDILEDSTSTIDANIIQIYKTKEKIEKFCETPKSREEIVAEIIDFYNIKMNINQYYLTSSTISAYLSYMTDEGVLKTEIQDNNMKWMLF